MEKRPLYSAVLEWLTNYKRTSVKAATYDRLLISCKMLEKNRISNFPVDDLRSIDIQRYVNELSEQGYSSSTIKKQFNLLTAYLKYAFSQNDISSLIYLAVRLPSEQSVKKTRAVEAYSRQEQREMRMIFDTLEKPAYAAAILMLETGLRVGEVLSLTWDDVNWNRKAVKVGKTLIRLSASTDSFVQYSAKSKSSNRTVPLSTAAIDILDRLAQIEGTKGFLFRAKDDLYTPESYSSLEFHIKAALKRIDIPYKGMHAFRHTFASNCYDRGCDVKLLSKLLGHADVSITYNTYIHLYGDELEEMRKVLG